jgi:2-amino-4-hydroxy-6-hydroxymethyldihydropteridine diphosphokinase
MIGGIFLLLGSNQGDKRQLLRQAMEKISLQIGHIKNVSDVYSSPAWGFTDQPDFVNQVVEIETELAPRKLLSTILDIETALGRVRNAKWGPRIIDIDILYYGDTIIHEPGLTIPHPEIQNRRFTLVPLVEIAASFLHPSLGQSNEQLLENCKDAGEVTRVAD